MRKTYFHDRIYNSEKKVKTKTIQLRHVDQKKIVDINKLLNRVRIDKKNETKRKIIFYSCSSMILFVLGAVIVNFK